MSTSAKGDCLPAKRFASFAALALAMVLLSTPVRAEPPSVVVSLPPVHSLVASVMGEIGAPHLMLRGGRSPHNAALRPSDLRRLRDADMVVWVSPALETFLAKAVAAKGRKGAILTLLDLQSVRKLSRRAGRNWEDHGHDHEAPRGVPDRVIDPHVWLSPANAIAIATAVSDALGARDPANAARYRANTQKLVARIGALENRLRRTLAPAAQRPYLVFHDAYQYFERHFKLNALGAIAVNPERMPGARRIAEIRETIERSGVRCVFREPQFPPRLLDTVIRGTRARTGILDPLGADIPPGPELWFQLMADLGRSLAECLGDRG